MRRQRLNGQNRLVSRPARKESSRLSETVFLVRKAPSKKAADVNIRPHTYSHTYAYAPSYTYSQMCTQRQGGKGGWLPRALSSSV